MIDAMLQIFGRGWNIFGIFLEHLFPTRSIGWNIWTIIPNKSRTRTRIMCKRFYILFLYKTVQIFQMFQKLEHQRFLVEGFIKKSSLIVQTLHSQPFPPILLA